MKIDTKYKPKHWRRGRIGKTKGSKLVSNIIESMKIIESGSTGKNYFRQVFSDDICEKYGDGMNAGNFRRNVKNYFRGRWVNSEHKPGWLELNDRKTKWEIRPYIDEEGFALLFVYTPMGKKLIDGKLKSIA